MVSASEPLPEAILELDVLAESGGEDEFLAHVLIAEDNSVNRKVVVAVLESLNCRVDAVVDGRQALDQLERSSSYDLVFMDCQMPTMDGLAATRAIRTRELAAARASDGELVRRLPIVALTAHALDMNREECLAAGMDAHLTKPFTKAELKDAIDRAKHDTWAAQPAAVKGDCRNDPPTPVPARQKRSVSTGARPAAPPSQKSSVSTGARPAAPPSQKSSVSTGARPAAPPSQKSSVSTGARPAAPPSRASAGNPAGRASEGRPAPRRKPKGLLPPAHQMPMGAPAASPPPPTTSAAAIGQVALKQQPAPVKSDRRNPPD